jgi:hypothetical protein
VNGVETRKQFTLGELIKWLEDHREMEVPDLNVEGCYRGYYYELALWPTGHRIKAKVLADNLRNCALDKEFEGYKGGEFTMSDTTPVWIGQWSTTAGSGRLIGWNPDTGAWLSAAEHW